MRNNAVIKLTTYTALALIAFAANSVLGRVALSGGAMDPTSFTTLRLWSGSIVLLLLVKTTSTNKPQATKGSWKASIMLYLYAASFSFAYLTLDTGMGALILFGAVQVTTVIVGSIKGQKLVASQWLGLCLALLGFCYLIKPEMESPSMIGIALMLVSGISWAGYTLLGSGSKNPLSDTAYNFLRTIPLTIPLVLITYNDLVITKEGLLLAVLSGGVTSGIGYAIWYRALRELKPLSAAVLQLLVPVLATFGGILFANEILSTSFIISSSCILSGALTVILSGYKKARE